MDGEISLTQDDWDPNIFLQTTHECRIYGDDNAQTWAVVSPHHYQACIKWRWRWKHSASGWTAGSGRGKSDKRYLARNRHARWDNGGQSRHNRTQENYFLHVFILEELMGKPRPSLKHIVDHRDGDEDNCREENLRWTTRKFNSKNVNGSHAGKEHDDEAQKCI